MLDGLRRLLSVSSVLLGDSTRWLLVLTLFLLELSS